MAGYQLGLPRRIWKTWAWTRGASRRSDTEVRVLALVSLHDEFRATANLMAPIVLNVKTRRGLQAIRRDSRYSHQHPVAGPGR